jgi:hypothetical protein
MVSASARILTLSGFLSLALIMAGYTAPSIGAARRVGSEEAEIIALLLAGAIALVPVMLSVGTGVLSWHLRQATAVQGGIEVFLLWVALGLAVSLPQSTLWRALLAAGLAWFYLRRHHVDVPLLVALLYVEGLIAVGSLQLGRRKARADASPIQAVAALLAGMIGFALAIWTASALGFGRPIQLSVLALAVLGVSALIARPKPLTLRLAGRWLDPARTMTERWLGGALVAWFLCLCARTNNVVDYDSLWYALRLPHVLVGERSFYEPLGLVSPVFYFPKLYESLMLPLAAFSDFSFQLCLTIAMLGVVAIMAAEFLRRVGLSTAYCLIGAATLITIPAFSNMALAAKPDLFAATLLLGAALATWSVGRGANVQQLGWAFALVLLAACAKINTIPYGAAILVTGAIASLLRQHSVAVAIVPPPGPVFPPGAGLFVAVLSVPLAAFVTARTWLLAGVPTIGPEQLVAIWKALGMQVLPPAGTFSWTRPAIWADAPQLLVDYLFFPDRLPHIVITWVGNVWAVLPLVGAALWLAGMRDRRPPTWVWWPALLTGLWLAFGTAFSARGGDGNYFLLPLALATLLALAWIGCRVQGQRGKTVLFVFLAAVSAWQASYAFVSAAWNQPGTRTLDLDLSRSPLDTRRTRANYLKHFGLAEIDAYLRKQQRSARIVGAADEFGMNWLLARAESFAQVSYARPEFLADAEGFRAFLRLSKIDYVIVPMSGGELKESELPPGVRGLLANFNWRNANVAGGERFALVDVGAAGR